MKFNGITRIGREYLAKLQSEKKPVEFSKIKIGNGYLDEHHNPAEIEDLISLKVEKSILSIEQEGDAVILNTDIDNVSLSNGYYPREIGVYVNDNGIEKLYYYMNDGDETSWIPPESDGPFKIELKIHIVVSNAQSILVQNTGKDLYISKEYFDSEMIKKVNKTDRASDTSYGLVKFGVDFKTALEGNKINEILGTNNYGGTIDTPGQKYEGMAYYDKATKEMFICTQNTNSTTASTSYFKPMSNKSLLNRLENLSNFNKETVSDTSNLKIKVARFGKIGIISIINSTVSPSQSIRLPAWFNVEEFFVASAYSKEESLGAEIGINGNTLTFYPLKTITELTGQIVVFLR